MSRDGSRLGAVNHPIIKHPTYHPLTNQQSLKSLHVLQSLRECSICLGTSQPCQPKGRVHFYNLIQLLDNCEASTQYARTKIHY